jgi:hypothetical protein
MRTIPIKAKINTKGKQEKAPKPDNMTKGIAINGTKNSSIPTTSNTFPVSVSLILILICTELFSIFI